MAFLYLFLYSIILILFICTFVSVIQFFIDLHRCSALRSELKELVSRAKLADAEVPGNKEVDNYDNKSVS